MEQSGAAVLQLQVTRMDFNWRRHGSESTYPNFESHTRRLMQYWASFSEFVRDLKMEPLVVRNAEVFKSSQILEGEGWNRFSDVSRLFPSLILSGFDDQWDVGGVASALDMVHSDGRVHIELKAGIMLAEQGRKALILEIRAEAPDIDSTSSKPGNLEERLTLANELVNLSFTSLTSSEVQKNVWGRTS
jgi:hypothetical protein